MQAPRAATRPAYVDVHAHLVHERIEDDAEQVAERARDAGLEYVIVNGLEPVSNRGVLELCSRYDHLLPALGIYPVDAICNHIDADNWPYDWPSPARFDIEAELRFIDEVADDLVAIGECGLDQHWVRDKPAEQEHVLRSLIEIAKAHDKPVILHSRRAEARTFEILQEMSVEKADFHCYGGKLKLARRIAAAGYYLSIPPVVVRAESFQRLAQELPLDRILTETDCPYMGPDPGERNEPANVPRGVAAMAGVRGIEVDEMAAAIRENFRCLFGV